MKRLQNLQLQQIKLENNFFILNDSDQPQYLICLKILSKHIILRDIIKIVIK